MMAIDKPYLELTGILTGTPLELPLPPGKYVYQKTKAGLGNIPGDPERRQQVRIWTAGTYVNTPAQIPYRARFRLGVEAWHELTEEEKEPWRSIGSKLGLNRFQAWMRNWCRTQPVPVIEGTSWDGGATTWDSGSTQWVV